MKEVAAPGRKGKADEALNIELLARSCGPCDGRQARVGAIRRRERLETGVLHQRFPGAHPGPGIMENATART